MPSPEELHGLGGSALFGEGAVTVPVSRVYRGSQEIDGHSYERGFTDFEHHMRHVFPDNSSVDAIIDGQIERAKKAGRDVVIMDLGGGVGNFSRQPLADPSLLARSRKKLAGLSTSTNVKFYSVTDSPSPASHLRQTPLPEADLTGNEQFTAHEVNYSITSTQTLKKLLAGIGEQSADLVVASSFMQYLRPPVFKAVIQDVIDVLRPGGRLMVFGYATIAGRYLSIDDGYAETNYPVTIANLAGSRVGGEELREAARVLVGDARTTAEQLETALANMVNVAFSSDYWGLPQLGDMRSVVKGAYYQRLVKGEAPRELINHFVGKILPMVEDQARVHEIQSVKDGLIDELAVANAAVASVNRRRIPHRQGDFEGIVIKKRTGGLRHH